jgi:hypothetical protein
MKLALLFAGLALAAPVAKAQTPTGHSGSWGGYARQTWECTRAPGEDDRATYQFSFLLEGDQLAYSQFTSPLEQLEDGRQRARLQWYTTIPSSDSLHGYATQPAWVFRTLDVEIVLDATRKTALLVERERLHCSPEEPEYRSHHQCTVTPGR